MSRKYVRVDVGDVLKKASADVERAVRRAADAEGVPDPLRLARSVVQELSHISTKVNVHANVPD